MFAPRPEIWDYLRRCADKYALSRTSGSAAGRAPGMGRVRRPWRVTSLSDGTVLTAASGALHVPSVPASRAPSASPARSSTPRSGTTCDLKGKRVAVIGTGASAIQFVPRIAGRRAAALFQRTPPWILPRPDRPIPRGSGAFRRVPGYSGPSATRSTGRWRPRGRLHRNPG